MIDVFVSYASADRFVASSIVQALEKQRWRVFWDRGIPAGRKWQDILEQHLGRARCVVVLLTRESLKSSWVTFEASIALQRRILVPLIVDPQLNPQHDLPEMYRDLHVVSLPTDNDLICSASHQDLWLRTIIGIVRNSKRRRAVRHGMALALTLLGLLASAYVALTIHNALTTWQAGLRKIERGTYSKEENERLKSAIREATLIELFVPNAASFTSAFRDDLPIFLRKQGSSMRILFADPNSELYDAMMTMTNKGFARDAKARASDKGLPDRARRILLDHADGASEKLQFRQFDTEFRTPIILIDRKYCFLTIRLTPDQSTESLRIELASESTGTALQQGVAHTLKSLAFFLEPSSQREDNVESCKRHFDAVWARSKDFQQ